MAARALYIIVVWILAGFGLGLLSTSYGACRKVYRFWRGVGEFLDWLWFVLAAAIFLVVGFWVEWGTFRIWAVVFVVVGYLLWSGLGAPLVLSLLSTAAWGQARALHYALGPFQMGIAHVKRHVESKKKPPEKP